MCYVWRTFYTNLLAADSDKASTSFCLRGILSHSDSLVSATEAQSVVLIGDAMNFLTLGVPRVCVALRRSGSAYL
jgi:hypothetical protein